MSDTNLPGWLAFWGEVLTFKERIDSTGAAKKAYEAGFLAGSATERAAREAAERERDEANKRADAAERMQLPAATAEAIKGHFQCMEAFEEMRAFLTARAGNAERETARKCAEIADGIAEKNDSHCGVEIAAAIRAAFNLEQKP